MGSSGYVKIHRKIKGDDFWPTQEKRSFTRLDAWLDILLSAAGLPKTIIYRDQSITLKRGEMIIAERKLGERWGWNRKRVHRFITFLIETGKIKVHRRDHRFTIIFIVKYSTYNPLISDIGSAKGTTEGTTEGTTGGANIKKEIKKEINKERSSTVSKILFDFEKEQFLNIKEKDIEGWKKAYPACEIDMELEQMKQWLLSNPDKKKKLYRRFITNWLSRSQDRGGSIRVSGHIRSMTRKEERNQEIEDWIKRPVKEKS